MAAKQSRLELVLVLALIAVFVGVLGSTVVSRATTSAGATTTTAQVYTVPQTIPSSPKTANGSCPSLTTDATTQLEAFFMSLPAGTPSSPVVVQFVQNQCYLVDGTLDLRDFTDYTFDGHGSTLVQNDVHPILYQYTDAAHKSQCATGVNWACEVVPAQYGVQALYCGDTTDMFGGGNSSNPISLDNLNFSSSVGYIGFGIMWWVEGGCNLTFRNFNLQGSWLVPQRQVAVDSYTAVTNAAGTQVTRIVSNSAHFTNSDVGRYAVSPNGFDTARLTIANLASCPAQAPAGCTAVDLSGLADTFLTSQPAVNIDYGDSSATPITDSLFEFNGVQRATITNNTLDNAWGDFVTLYGVHEGTAAAQFPSTDVTITNNTMNISGRQGITPEYITRALISGNTITAGVSTATVIDLEADVGNTCTCDVNVTGNTFNDAVNSLDQGYAYLVAADTTNNLDRFAFTSNTINGQLKIHIRPAEGSNITISKNTASQQWDWPFAAINLQGNTASTFTNVDVEGNQTPLHNIADGPRALVSDSTPGCPTGVVANSAQMHVRNNTLTGTPNSFGQALLDPGHSGNCSASPAVLASPASAAATCGNSVPGNAVEPIDGTCGSYTQPTAPAAVTQTPVDYPAVSTVSPGNGTFVGGTEQGLDSILSDQPAATGSVSVKFEIGGGPNKLSNDVVATATPTLFGYAAWWNTTTVPNGLYSLMTVACNGAGNCSASPQILIVVDNPTTTVLVPSNGANLAQGVQTLDASASDSQSAITSVQFEISGNGLTNDVVANTSTWTAFGWVSLWAVTSAFPHGTYALQSIACNAKGICDTSPSISITV